MKLSISHKIVILFLFLLSAFGILAYAVQTSNKQTLISTNLIKHTKDIIFESENILSLILDIETSTRGYVITKDSSFLEPFKMAERYLLVHLSILEEMIKTNPTQIIRVHDLKNLIENRIKIAKTTIHIRNSEGMSSVIRFMSEKKGKIMSDDIRHLIFGIQTTENILLHYRKLENKKNIEHLSTLIFVLFFSMAVLLIIFLIVMTRFLKENKEKISRENELMFVNNELEYQQREKIIQESAHKELEAFSYSVSHDLRAPLRHVSGFVDLLLKKHADQLDETGLRYLQTISASATEMGNLIDALLSFSRLNRQELTKTNIQTITLVQRIIKLFSEETENRNIQLEIKNLPDCYGNEDLLHQVWFNLISNAYKYTRNTKFATISINGEIKNNMCIYSIKDNGAGFDMKYSSKLFGVFQRLHKNSEFEGIGIGLANVFRIVSRHGGSCSAEGEIGHGATFQFSLPLKK